MTAVIASRKYRHYKQATHYVVICVGEHVDTKERLVTYRVLDVIGRNWVRPEKEFFDEVAPGVLRFTPVVE